MNRAFGRRVREIREKLGVKRAYLARKANLSLNHLIDIEVGERDDADLNSAQLRALARVLQRSVLFLVAGDEESRSHAAGVVAERQAGWSALRQTPLWDESADSCTAPGCGGQVRGTTCDKCGRSPGI